MGKRDDTGLDIDEQNKRKRMRSETSHQGTPDLAPWSSDSPTIPIDGLTAANPGTHRLAYPLCHPDQEQTIPTASFLELYPAILSD
jgi:hypothetical protein